MQHIIADCTEFFFRPFRTGIQRVVREMLRNWPEGEIKLYPARVDPQRGLIGIPSAVIDLLIEKEPRTRHLPLEEIQRQQITLLQQYEEPVLPLDAAVLIPEIFYDPQRCALHEARSAGRPGSLLMLAYDFMPYLRPDIFSFTSAATLMVYLRLMSLASNVAFISEHTRRDFADRVLRVDSNDPRVGPVLPLGADGLRLDKQGWRGDRRMFVCLGSLEDRKNQHIVVEAFIHLWEQGHDVPLTLIGRKFHQRPLEWLDRALSFPQFTWLSEASDEQVAFVLANARATIFLSTAEGYGLPPVESLSAGIPVITLKDIPSIAMLEPLGQIWLTAATTSSVSEAVIKMADDGTAARLWAEAAGLELETWQSFGAEIARWCAGLPEPLTIS